MSESVRNSYPPDEQPASPAPEAEAQSSPTAEELMAMGVALEPFTGRNITRRKLLEFGMKVCGLAAASATANAAMHYVEAPIMDATYEQHDTKLIYSGTNIRRPAKNAGLASQGWGITQSSSIISSLIKEDVYPESFPFAGFSCSSRGISLAALEQCGVHFADYFDPKEVDVHAVSEGLMIALTGARAAGRHLRLVSSYDSPNSIDDAYHSLLAKGLATANHLGIYHGGMIGKLAACMAEEVDRDGFLQLITGWRQAVKSTVTGGDPRMMVSELTFLNDTNLLHEWKSFRHIIDKDTNVFILRTKQAETDRVVKDEQADHSLLEMYHNLGATATVILVDTPGHADTPVGIATAAPHYKRALGNAA